MHRLWLEQSYRCSVTSRWFTPGRVRNVHSNRLVGLTEEDQLPTRLALVNGAFHVDPATEFLGLGQGLTSQFAHEPGMERFPARVHFQKGVHAGEWGWHC